MAAQELRDKYRDALGEEFGTIYYHVYSEWCDIWVTWRQWEALFGSGPEKVELLNESSSLFFHTVQRRLQESVALGICRLADPIETMGRKNLSVRQFSRFMKTDKQKEKLDDLIDKLDKSSRFARDWRNRRISHNDYDDIIGNVNSSAVFDRREMTGARDSIYDILAFVQLEFLDSGLINEVIMPHDAYSTLFDSLFLGRIARANEADELKRGNSHVLDRPDWLHADPQKD